MTRDDQARDLAKFLTPMLRGATGNGGPAHLSTSSRREELVDRLEPDVDLAVRLELESLLRKEPKLATLLSDTSRWDPEEVSGVLTRRLAEGDDHAVELLWALLAGRNGQPHSEVLRVASSGRSTSRARRGRIRAGLTSLAKAVWLRRKIAAILMNALIGLVFLIAWSFAWPPPDELEPTGALALAVFAVWCLSFLPGWMYVRFLGQRAGALWDEYVLNLHRLAWDCPGNLPKPPVNSQFYTEWFNDNGVLLAHRQNIYRQKFDAYYGKSVSQTSHAEGSPVRIETLFPVFLLTATLAVCWTALLWDPGFISSPSTVWDVLKFGFLGAYSFIIQMLIRRFFQSDLRPSAYASAMLRIVVVLILVAALHQLIPADNVKTEAAVAFVIGFFPLVGMQALQRTAAAVLRAFVPTLNPAYPLNQIDGLSVWYEARLLEEGIEDMQSLATANFVDVLLHTRVPVGRLVDWVDQANLYLHLDRIERGWLERRFPMSREKGEASVQPVAHGSVTATSRAGTRTRTALRQLGIRKATDLLKAFPPDKIDPDSPPRPDSGWAAHLRALAKGGLDLNQVRSIVRVLDTAPSPLAPIWNWQKRGVGERS
jgi:hypothetical protein